MLEELTMFRRLWIAVGLMVGVLAWGGQTSVLGQGGSGPPISLHNAYRIEEQAVFGRGTAKVVAWSPNGKQLAVGSTAGIWLYDTSDFGAPPHRLEPLVDIVDMAYSPDGTRLAMVSEGGAVVMWDAVIADHRIAFSADSKVLAVQFDPPMLLWDVETGEQITSLVTKVPETLGISHIPYSIVSSASESAWTLEDTTATGPQTLLYEQGETVSLNEEGILAVVAGNGTLQLVDAQTGNVLRSLGDDTLKVSRVDFSPDNVTLVSVCSDRAMRLWNVNTGELLHVLNEPWHGEIISVAFNVDGTLLASATESSVRVWDPATGNVVHTFEGYSPRRDTSYFGGEMLSVAYSPDGTVLASGAGDSTISLWDARTGQRQSILYGHVAGISSLAYAPDGTLLASGSYDHTIRLWDTKAGETRRILLKDAESMVIDLAFNPSGTVLAAATYSPNVLLWDVNTGALLHELEGHTGLITSVTFSHDGTVLASGSRDMTIRLWNMTNYASLAVLTGHTDEVTDVAFNSAGDRLASTSIDGVVRLWSVPEGIPINAISADNTRWSTVAFNQDDTIIIAGGSWGVLQLWKSDTGAQIADLAAYAESIRDIAVSPLGDTIASADAGGVVRIWGIPAEQTALQPGGTATIHVTDDETLNVRDAPGLESSVIGILTNGMRVIVCDGPQASDGYTWWLIETPAGALGWVVEAADGVQTLIP
jgi:WD40 repeat protein